MPCNCLAACCAAPPCREVELEGVLPRSVEVLSLEVGGGPTPIPICAAGLCCEAVLPGSAAWSSGAAGHGWHDPGHRLSSWPVPAPSVKGSLLPPVRLPLCAVPAAAAAPGAVVVRTVCRLASQACRNVCLYAAGAGAGAAAHAAPAGVLAGCLPVLWLQECGMQCKGGGHTFRPQAGWKPALQAGPAIPARPTAALPSTP